MKNKPVRSITPEEKAYAKTHIRHENSYKTICQLIRDIFLEAEKTNNFKIRGKALDVYVYAKRMNSALRNRNGAYDVGWWSNEGKGEAMRPEETMPFTTA